jgi:two-component system response regulator PilR (NtrC family)
MPDGSGMQVLEAAKRRDDALQVIMITAFASTEQAVEAMRLGAYDYIQKPFKNNELLAQLEKALEKSSIVHENRALRAHVKAAYRIGDLVGKGARMQAVMELVRRVASGRSSVLITGESGTGKEVVARALHQTGERAALPFITVNCGALPENLMESELFGHEKGAFTGASSKKDGLIRAAHGGTLFLDEIGELPTPLQVKLLRVLQERKVRPVGAQQEIEVDVRVVAATNRDVEASVREGSFRQDLFYRLNVIRIQLPPLRERKEDIPTLAAHFLQKHSAIEGKRLSFSPEALSWIAQQEFPGNVRELENKVHQAMVVAAGPMIEVEDVSLPTARAPTVRVDVDRPFRELKQEMIDTFERSYLTELLRAHHGNLAQAARAAGMDRKNLWALVERHGLDREQFKKA